MVSSSTPSAVSSARSADARAIDRVAPLLRELEVLHGRTFRTLTAMLQLLGDAQGEAGLHDMVAQPTIAAFAEALSHTASARGATLAAHEQLDRLSRKFGIVWADGGDGIGDGQKYPSFTTARQAA